MTHSSSFPDRSATAGLGSSGPAGDAAPDLRKAAGFLSDCVNSTELLRGQKSVEISHNGATYRLQATRQGKLILTK